MNRDAMSGMINPDSMNRLAKLAMDMGEVQTYAQAIEQLKGYRLAVAVGPELATSPTLQAALLTIVNAGRRCFLGGVWVTGDTDVALKIPWRRCRSVRDAVIDLQGKFAETIDEEAPLLLLGSSPLSGTANECALQVTFDGWLGGVTPLADQRRLHEAHEFTPAGVLAGALAISETFQYIRGDHALAGRREVGLSLWQPDPAIDWLRADPGPILNFLPEKLWLIGLGHLGQAYLWTLGFLPYARPEQVLLVLQDYDSLATANDSTSLLTCSSLIGTRKTRAMAAWCEERGFRSSILERYFADNFRVDGKCEPHTALCGVDNALARLALEDVGFAHIIEAGLGKGPQEYLGLQVHTFPTLRAARTIWSKTVNANSDNETLLANPAYQDLAAKGVDRCGLVELASRSVGAAFVGAVTSTLVIAEVLRVLLGGPRYELIDIDLRAVGFRQATRISASTYVLHPGMADISN
jgi:hypothetical protein